MKKRRSAEQIVIRSVQPMLAEVPLADLIFMIAQPRGFPWESAPSTWAELELLPS